MTDKNNNASVTAFLPRMEFIIAICAILISLASFYATYLQADAANKQVKAMTLPLVHFVHSNYDSGEKVRKVSYQLINAGVGPAKIQSVIYRYNGEDYLNREDYFKACCKDSYKEYFTQQEKKQNFDIESGLLTSDWSSTIIPGQADLVLFSLRDHRSNASFWDQLNQVRWSTEVEVCYCSLLDDCYVSTSASSMVPIEQCP